ncbi:MAG: GNAT family N-acetyltransferase [Gemmatimonadales bacterium]
MAQSRAPARELAISPLQGEAEAHACARLMAASEPWITLGRSYETSLGIIVDRSREVYLARDETGLAGFVILCMTGAFVGYIQTVCIDPSRRGQGLGFQAGRVCGAANTEGVTQCLYVCVFIQPRRQATV